MLSMMMKMMTAGAGRDQLVQPRQRHYAICNTHVHASSDLLLLGLRILTINLAINR